MLKGIVNVTAPELSAIRWIGPDGEPREPLSLVELGDGFRVLYFFQHWCSGCHEYGFPTLRVLMDDLEAQVGFAAVQTVFEGEDVNTFERLREIQRRYDLAIPLGHAAARSDARVPAIMSNYRSGGTPWFVVIAPDGHVVFNDFQIDPKGLIAALQR